MNKHLVATCVPVGNLTRFLMFVVCHTSVTLESGEKPYCDDLQDMIDGDRQNVCFYYQGGLETQLAYTQDTIKKRKIGNTEVAVIKNSIFKIVDENRFWKIFCNNTLML